ncbi:WecB/TagA/CpsF family glycosyltransferase [Thermus thermophilus]|uniref:WecB/TagA/CpsF family glycosyltransferase n=1 Tax=Thermus thermophilus TaxID=274 RepID=UPI0030E21431
MGRLTLLGVEVDPVGIDELHRAIGRAVAEGKRIVIANHNLHSVYLFHKDPKMRAFFARADLIHIDGMPLVYWGRLMGKPIDIEHRVTYVDWVRPLMAEAVRHGWRVYYLGGKPGVAERAASQLRAEFPGLFLQTHHGYFDMAGEENEEVLRRINAYRPHVLMVGMGMPRQEHWVLDNLERLETNAVLTAGACFDYVAEAIPTPPRWMGRVGLEWLYRLFSEPKRLWRRYLVEPWYLVPYAVEDLRRRLQGG